LASGGREPLVLNAMILPRQGLMRSIPLYRSTNAHLNIGIITGLTETTNPDGSTPVSEPQGCCDDYPQAGLMTMCEWCSPWGMFGRQSRIYSLCEDDGYCDTPMDVVGDVLNRRREMRSRRPRGMRGSGGGTRRRRRDDSGRYAPRDGGRGGSAFPDGMIFNERNILNSTYDKAMFELAATFQRDMAPMYFSGNPQSTNGVFRPFLGLASIINTGYMDAVSRRPCPDADSIVMSVKDTLGVDKVCENAAGFVNLVSGLVSNSKQISYDMGLGIIDGVFIGPSWMRDCLIRMWVCGYGGCSCCGEAMDNKSLGGVVMHTMTSEATQMRDEMMQESYIVVDGMPIPWIVDDSDDYSSFDKTTGVRTGRLFFTPLTVMNGTFPVFYQQYRPWDTQEIRRVISQWSPAGTFMPQGSPNGAWMLFKKPPQNLCLQIAGVTKRRLAHHAPFLAFQLTDISCCTYTPPRAYGGGRTEGPAPEDCVGIPSGGGTITVNAAGDTSTVPPVMAMDKPFCVTLKNEDGVPTPTTVYLQANGCYLLADGCEVDLGDICPEAGACVVEFSATEWCFNPWSGASFSVWLQEDGSYNMMMDGTGDTVDTTAGTLCEGECPVVYTPTQWCINPHVGDPISAWLQEDGTYTTEMDGTGSVVGTTACDVVAGECPVTTEGEGDSSEPAASVAKSKATKKESKSSKK